MGVGGPFTKPCMFQVEYWFRKLVDESSERNMFPRRRRQYRMLPDEDLCVHPSIVTFKLYLSLTRFLIDSDPSKTKAYGV